MIEAELKVLGDAGEWHGLVKRKEALVTLSIAELYVVMNLRS